jgi:hypothetical protein
MNWYKAIARLLIFCCAIPPAFAFQPDSLIDDPIGFTCSSNFGSCVCDGSYENCNAMEESCKDQKIECTTINQQKLCTCLMATQTNLDPDR